MLQQSYKLTHVFFHTIDYSDFIVPSEVNYYLNSTIYRVCINLMAVADILVETNETFYADVSLQNPLDTFLEMASVLIIDDDGKIEVAKLYPHIVN